MTASYSYDENNNRLKAVRLTGEESGVYDSQDRIVTYGGIQYSYIPGGNLSSKVFGQESTLYRYDVIGNLREVTLPDGTSIEYLIDGRNRRIGKKVNGVLVQGLLYNGQIGIVAELDGNNQVVSRFVYGSKQNVPDYMVKEGRTYFLISDHLGSIRLVVDVVTGDVVQRIDYDEFGIITQDTNPSFQPFGFAGGLFDNHTKLTRFGARDYDAQTGRWSAKDPVGFLGEQTNLYSYVLMDPVNIVDPDGLWFPLMVGGHW